MAKRLRSQDDPLFAPWFQTTEPEKDCLVLMTELPGGREAVYDTFINTVADHFVDLSVIENMGGFEKSAHVLRNRLPESKRTQSGDLGEIIATEFVDRTTTYKVPIRRLRFKDDRNLAMRGDDVLGFRRVKATTLVLKVESKSRISLSAAVVNEARDGLAKRDGRPNPSTLAFIEYLLRKDNRDEEAEIIAQLQQVTIRSGSITHLVFTLSENNPTRYLSTNSAPIIDGITLRLCGCRVQDHANFVKSVFNSCLALGALHGDS